MDALKQVHIWSCKLDNAWYYRLTVEPIHAMMPYMAHGAGFLPDRLWPELCASSSHGVSWSSLKVSSA